MDNEHNSAVKTILGVGEERMGDVINMLLSNETFANAFQQAITGGLAAKRLVDKNVERALDIANVPTLEEVDAISEKLSDLEDLIAEVGERVAHVDDRLGALEVPKKRAKSAPKRKAAAKKATSKGGE